MGGRRRERNGLGLSALRSGDDGQPPRARWRRPASSLAITLTASPSASLTVPELQKFQLDFVVRNVGTSTIDPRLGASTLLVDGSPATSWPMTINNGPRDSRWEALPPGEELRFGYALRDALFKTQGRYVLVLLSNGVPSAPLVVTVK